MKSLSSYKVAERNETSIILDSNESPINYSSARIAYIVKRLRMDELNRYPDADSNKLRELYAKYIELDKDNIIAGHGSDEMLGLIISKYISKGKKLYTLSPDFSMYDFYVSINQGDIIKHKTNDDGSFDLCKFVEEGKHNNVDLIMFSNPNNPTGFTINLEQIKYILGEFKDKKVVIDEAYVEFYGESSVKLINEFSNLIVTRTLSKAWGLASLRVGFLISNKENVKELAKYKPPYNVSAMSQIVACNILSNEDINENVKKIMEWKEELYTQLSNIEKDSVIAIKFYKGEANFIYGRVEYKDAILKQFERRNIRIRSFNDDTFRITVGTPSQNKMIIDLIKEACIYEGEF